MPITSGNITPLNTDVGTSKSAKFIAGVANTALRASPKTTLPLVASGGSWGDFTRFNISELGIGQDSVIRDFDQSIEPTRNQLKQALLSHDGQSIWQRFAPLGTTSWSPWEQIDLTNTNEYQISFPIRSLNQATPDGISSSIPTRTFVSRDGKTIYQSVFTNGAWTNPLENSYRSSQLQNLPVIQIMDINYSTTPSGTHKTDVLSPDKRSLWGTTDYDIWNRNYL